MQTLDPKRIAKKYQALVVSITPPRYWTLDWFADRVGEVRSFDGLDAAWMGNSQAPQSKSPPSLLPMPIAIFRSREPRSRESKKVRKSTCSTTPRAGPG